MCIFKDCDLSFLFGVENEGIHKYRILDSPIVDHVLNLITAGVITYITQVPLELTIPLWYLFGILIHYLFGINSGTIRYLNLEC